jgi:hypothetical protein
MITRLNLNTNQQQNSELNSNNKMIILQIMKVQADFIRVNHQIILTLMKKITIKKTVLSPPSPMVLPTTNSPPITSLVHITSTSEVLISSKW